MTLEEIRRDIDGIDDAILGLLEARMRLALMARRRKRGTRDPAREAELLARLEDRASAGGVIEPGFVADLYGTIMAYSRGLQDRSPTLAGFAGGVDAPLAGLLRERMPEAVAIPFGDRAALLAALREGVVDRAALFADGSPDPVPVPGRLAPGEPGLAVAATLDGGPSGTAVILARAGEGPVGSSARD